MPSRKIAEAIKNPSGIVGDEKSGQRQHAGEPKIRQQQADFLFDEGVHDFAFFNTSEATKISSSESDSHFNSSG